MTIIGLILEFLGFLMLFLKAEIFPGTTQVDFEFRLERFLSWLPQRIIKNWSKLALSLVMLGIFIQMIDYIISKVNSTPNGTANLLSSLVTTGATVALALFTWKYVRLTNMMVAEMKKVREPIVVIDFKAPLIGHFQSRITMMVSNKGITPAKNILINPRHSLLPIIIDKPGTGSNVESELVKFIELLIFKEVISYLSPGETYKINLGTLRNEDIAQYPKVDIDISYEDELRNKTFRNITFDFKYISELTDKD